MHESQDWLVIVADNYKQDGKLSENAHDATASLASEIIEISSAREQKEKEKKKKKKIEAVFRRVDEIY